MGRGLVYCLAFAGSVLWSGRTEGVRASETGLPALVALENGDANGDGSTDLSDGVYLLAHLFAGGPAPAAIHCKAGRGEGGDSPTGYVFRPMARMGDSAPGGGTFVTDFEPNQINQKGDVIFGADLSTGAGVEGVWLTRHGVLSQVARGGEPAPGGGTFAASFPGPTSLNDEGDAALAWRLLPLTGPSGSLNTGVFRHSRVTGALSAVMLPNVTPAPGGGVFRGARFATCINNRGDLLFHGIIDTPFGTGKPPGQGVGIFKADGSNEIESVVSPGDAAPGGGAFDNLRNAWINDRGDVAFGGHVAGEECISAVAFSCAESLYVKRASSDEIESIAHEGDPAPGGGFYRLAFGGRINNRGDIVFIGDLTAPPLVGVARAVFLHVDDATVPVARPGDPMPGGGSFMTASFLVTNYFINDRGDVSFNAKLDTDDNGDGIPDTGIYVRSRGGKIQLVARTGTVIPGVGTVAHLSPPAAIRSANGPLSGALINNHGQVFFQVTLSDGLGVLLVATPRDGDQEGDQVE